MRYTGNMDTPLQAWIAQQMAIGKSLDDIASEVGVTRQAVDYWKRGVSRPGTQTLPVLMRKTGLGIEELLV